MVSIVNTLNHNKLDDLVRSIAKLLSHEVKVQGEID